MKRDQVREYVKPRIESYESRQVVESLGTAVAGVSYTCDGTIDIDSDCVKD